MYTRFKSQKSGIKVGLNTIANTARSRVVVSPSAPSTNNNIANKIIVSNEDISLINPIITTASIVVVDTDDKNNDLVNNNENLLPFDFVNGTKSNNKKSSHHYKNSDKNFNQERSKQDDEKRLNDEVIDVTSINYVKSMWEKYANEIGKQDGPLMHVDEKSQYEHLKGFVAFDMEQWWAERSISSMISNDKKIFDQNNSNANDPNKSNNCKDINNNSNNIYDNNIKNGNNLKTIRSKSIKNHILINQDNIIDISKKYNPKYSFNLSVSKNVQNNLQMCFS